jgi:hypothetical protein
MVDGSDAFIRESGTVAECATPMDERDAGLFILTSVRWPSLLPSYGPRLRSGLLGTLSTQTVEVLFHSLPWSLVRAILSFCGAYMQPSQLPVRDARMFLNKPGSGIHGLLMQWMLHLRSLVYWM